MIDTGPVQESLFTVAKLEDFVPKDHPLRAVRELVNEALVRLNGLFDAIYADNGRATIPPDKLIRATMLQMLYSIRSECEVVEQLQYNLLFRWFVGLAIDGEIWHHSVFSKNRDWLLEHDAVEGFLTEVMTLADKRGLLSKEHFSIDDKWIQPWANRKIVQPKVGPDDQNPDGSRGGVIPAE